MLTEERGKRVDKWQSSGFRAEPSRCGRIHIGFQELDSPG